MSAALNSYVEKHGVAAAAEAAGCTTSHIRNLIAGRKRASPDLAIRMHSATRGEVPGSDLCPSMWLTPDDVPVREAVE